MEKICVQTRCFAVVVGCEAVVTVRARRLGWAISFDRARTWTRAANVDTSLKEFRMYLRDACDGVVVSFDAGDEPAAFEPDYDEAVFGWVFKSYVTEPEMEEHYGCDTVYGFGLMGFYEEDDGSGLVYGGDTWQLVPVECVDRAAALWKSTESSAMPVDLAGFLTEQSEKVSAAVAGVHVGDRNFDGVLEMAAVPTVFVPDGDDGWFVVGLTDNPVFDEGSYVYDADFDEDDYGSPLVGPLRAHLSDDYDGDEDLVAYLSGFVHQNTESDDYERDADDVVLATVCDLVPDILAQGAAVENGDLLGAADLAIKLRETAEMLYRNDVDQAGSFLYDVSHTLALTDETVVAAGCDVNEVIRNRCSEKLDDVVVFVLAWLGGCTAGAAVQTAEADTSETILLDNQLYSILMTTLQHISSLPTRITDGSQRHRWQRTSSYLLRALKKAKPVGGSTQLRDPRRALKLCKQFCEQSYPRHLGIYCPPMLTGMTRLEILTVFEWRQDQEFGWSLRRGDEATSSRGSTP